MNRGRTLGSVVKTRRGRKGPSELKGGRAVHRVSPEHCYADRRTTVLISINVCALWLVVVFDSIRSDDLMRSMCF